MQQFPEIEALLQKLAEIMQENKILDYVWIGQVRDSEYRVRATAYETWPSIEAKRANLEG